MSSPIKLSTHKNTGIYKPVINVTKISLRCRKRIMVTPEGFEPPTVRAEI